MSIDVSPLAGLVVAALGGMMLWSLMQWPPGKDEIGYLGTLVIGLLLVSSGVAMLLGVTPETLFAEITALSSNQLLNDPTASTPTTTVPDATPTLTTTPGHAS